MTKNRDLKVLIRARMQKTGESYTTARRHIADTPSPPVVDEIKGWRRIAERGMPEDYEIRVDDQGYRSATSALIRSRRDSAVESSTKLMQHFLAEEYRGCRIRLSAWIKTEALTGACLLWMEIDENRKLLVGATSHPVTGTAEWTSREVVLDVDEEATLVMFAIVVHGAGAAWVSDIEIEEVGTDVPVTASRRLPTKPRNLNFAD
jgi:hypothetical protein